LLMLSGLGQMIDIVIHEIGAPVGKIARQLVILEKETAKIEIKPLNRISSRNLSHKRLARSDSTSQAAGIPRHPQEGTRNIFYVKDAVEDCLQLCESLLTKQGVRTEILEPDGPIRVKMARASFDQILYNLVDNSVYWTGREHGEGGRPASSSVIKSRRRLSSRRQ